MLSSSSDVLIDAMISTSGEENLATFILIEGMQYSTGM